MFTHHLIKRSLAGGLVIAAAGFPSAAQAMVVGGDEGSVPVAPPASVSSAPQGLNQLQRNVQEWFAVHGRFPSSVVSSPSTPVGPTDASSGGYDFTASAAPVTAQPGASFDWGDAGIGAGGAVLLLGTAALGASVTRRRRAALS